MNWLKRLFGRGTSGDAAHRAVTMQKEAGNLYVLRIGGVIDKATVDRIQAIGAASFASGATQLKVLIVLNEFRGWKRGDDWGDLNFFAQYEQNIAKIAVVGEPRWETEMLIFLAAGRRTGQVRYFSLEGSQKARAWLAD